MKIEQVLVSTFLYVPVYSQVKGPINWGQEDYEIAATDRHIYASGMPHMITVTETRPPLPRLSTLNDSVQWMIAANFFLKKFSAIQLHSHVIQLPLHKFILESSYASDRRCWNNFSLRFIGDSIAYPLIAQAYYVVKWHIMAKINCASHSIIW